MAQMKKNVPKFLLACILVFVNANGENEYPKIFESFELNVADRVKFLLLKGENGDQIAKGILDASLKDHIDQLIVAASIRERNDGNYGLLSVAKKMNHEKFSERANVFVQRCCDLGEIQKMCVILDYLQREEIAYSRLLPLQISNIMNSVEFIGFANNVKGARLVRPIFNEIKYLARLNDMSGHRPLIESLLKIANSWDSDSFRFKEDLQEILKCIDEYSAGVLPKN